MTFISLSLVQGLLLLLATVISIFLLYWLKPPPQRVVVPSTIIWQRVLRERKRRSDFWRWLVSLVIALDRRARPRFRHRKAGARGAFGPRTAAGGGRRQLTDDGCSHRFRGNPLGARPRDRRKLPSRGECRERVPRRRYGRTARFDGIHGSAFGTRTARVAAGLPARDDQFSRG